MFSQETAASAGVPNYIVFYYKRDTIFNTISLKTLYKAKTIKNSKDEAMIDEYALSADETDAFLLFMSTALYDAFNIVSKMTAGLTDAPVIDGNTAIGGSEDVPNTYNFKIVDEAAYNSNVLYIVDDGINKYIQYHILADWYELVGLDAEYVKHAALRDAARIDLTTNRLFQLRKPLLT